jgi:acyl-CoA thioesterase FadM
MDLFYFAYFHQLKQYSDKKQAQAQKAADAQYSRAVKKAEQNKESKLQILAVPKLVPYKPITYIASTYGRCNLADMDWNWHKNNSRYLRDFDFARLKLFYFNGIWHAAMKRRDEQLKATGNSDIGLALSGLDVRFKRAVQLWEEFRVQSNIIGWSGRELYIQQVMTLIGNKPGSAATNQSPKATEKNGKPVNAGPIVCASGMARLIVVGTNNETNQSLTVDDLLRDLGYSGLKSPPFDKSLEEFKLSQIDDKPQFPELGKLRSRL